MVWLVGSMLRAAARRRLRSRRRHSSSHFNSGREGSGFELLARHLTSCVLTPQGHATEALDEQGADSLHATKVSFGDSDFESR